jgi:hypothetical protein
VVKWFVKVSTTVMFSGGTRPRSSCWRSRVVRRETNSPFDLKGKGEVVPVLN